MKVRHSSVLATIIGVLVFSQAAFAQSPFFVDRFTGSSLNVHLQDADSAFRLDWKSIGLSACEPYSPSANRHHITTLRSDYLSSNWTYEITFNTPANAPDDILFIGFGQGEGDSSYFNEPLDSVNFRIHQGENGFWAGWRVDVAAHSLGSGVFTYLETIGYLPPGPEGGIFTARIRKIGSQVSFEILDTSPAISVTIPDITTTAPFLSPFASRIFFGNASCVYSYGDLRVLPASVDSNDR